MPYTINHFDTTKLADVQDGRYNDDYTHIKFVGRNFAGYGEIQNENFLWLLENFASSSQPTKKVAGMVWFDSGNKKLKFWDGNYFRTTGGAEVGDTQPPTATPPVVQQRGDFWYNTKTKQVFVYDGSNYVLVGPQAVEDRDQTDLESVKLYDTSGNPHGVIKGVVDGTVAFFMSKDSFTIAADARPTGFTDLHQGITLINTGTDGITTSAYRFWGTASNALSLNGVDSDLFVQKLYPNFSAASSVGQFPDIGFTVGANQEIKMFMDVVASGNSNNTANPNAFPIGRLATIYNEISDSLYFRTKSGSNIRTPLMMKNFDLTPGASLAYNLGTDSVRWNTIYAGTINATTIVGNITGGVTGIASKASTIIVDPAASDVAWTAGTSEGAIATHYRSARTTAIAYSIAARDGSGDITANLFKGTATQAQYADLAERYAADSYYEPGTVLVFGGEQEVTTTVTVADTRVAGVVSTNPAHLMNAESGNNNTHPAVALRGKIPVKVSGSVKKGDVLVSSFIPGYAEVAANQFTVPAAAIIGKSLENKEDTGTGIIMMVV